MNLLDISKPIFFLDIMNLKFKYIKFEKDQ